MNQGKAFLSIQMDVWLLSLLQGVDMSKPRC